MRNASATNGEFSEHLFKDLVDETHILVAVSGGSDSIALLYLLNDWAKVSNRAKLTVATIDHGLRKAAAGEAKQVGLIAQQLGLPHVTKLWKARKPQSGVSQKAREARYALLSEIARDVGATTIALGHNLDDQRETILMRAERSGYSNFENLHDDFSNIGLSGIRPKSTYCGPPNFTPVGLVRPLLTIARGELRSYLGKIGVSWIDDPSNKDVQYERVRLRRTLEAHPENYPSGEKISKFSDQVALFRENLALDCVAVINKHVHWQQYLEFADGVLLIEREAFADGNSSVMQYLLRVLIGIVGGRDFYIGPSKAVQLVDDIKNGLSNRSSLGSTIVDLQRDQICIWRENRNLPTIETDETSDHVICWDGRIIYRFSAEQLKQGLVLRALGEEGFEQFEDDLRQLLKPLSQKSLITQPAIFSQGQLVFAPFLPWKADGFAAPEFQYWSPSIEQFLPECDFQLAREITQLRHRTHNQANIV